jgi:cyclophilin family peptidyl-prolyl cis-trans isomerase
LFNNQLKILKRIELMSCFAYPIKRIRSPLIFLLATLSAPSIVLGNFTLRLQTDLGGLDIELFDTAAPQTVDNFMNYVTDADYDGTFIHRRATVDTSGVSVLQMGGFIFNPDDGDLFGTGTSHIATDPPVVNEFDGVNRPNVRGSMAMAKPNGEPDGATSEWFFNVDDNPGLDDPANSGGFTVFGRVVGNGMDVIDEISSLSRCRDVVPFVIFCGNLPDVPVTLVSTSDELLNRNLVNILHIGSDMDGDGAIDDQEDEAPNGGDGNNDTVTDSTQSHVASYPGSTGETITIEAPATTALQSLDILGITYLLAHPDESDVLTDLDFHFGYASYELTGLAAAGDSATVSMILPGGAVTDTFFNFGPTPGDQTNHWYEFLFDGETGAEFNGNVVTLHFSDGKRGDTDLVSDGVITVSPGGPANLVGDGDGIDDEIENAAPNNGDGNGDGILDSTQGHVVSLPDLTGNSYVTVETSAANLIQSMMFFAGPEFDPSLDSSNPATYNPPKTLEGFNFSHGFLSFRLAGIASGDTATVVIYLPERESPKVYFMYGPTPENMVPHWFKFNYDGETGATFDGNVITLHFVDGKRGDADLTANGVIVDPGAPAVKAENSGSDDGGGGCSMANNIIAGRPSQAGDWWLLLVLLVFLRQRSFARRAYY